MQARGKVYLLGAGPGDPELVTMRALRHLAAADLVLYDALAHPDLLAHCRPDAERVFVGKRAGRSSERQVDINRRMITAAQAGLTVARLKGGDPYLFGRGSEEAEQLAAAGVDFEVVPGVPSPLAAAAYAGLSLTHRELASSIAYLTATESEEKDESAHDWPKLATATQTLVIFMGVRKLDSLMQLLMANGRAPDCPAAVVQSASLPSQRTVVGTVATIAELARNQGLGMPALTVVGKVVRLREELRWYDRKPLFGKRVLITRAAEQANGMVQALRDAGADALVASAIRIAPPDDPGQLSRAVREAGSYDWLLFTSANGVRAFFAELDAQRGDARRLAAARVAVIGPATADALRARGVVPDVQPDEYRGEALAEALIAAHGRPLRGARVLLARAAVARDVLPDRLRAEGAEVSVVAAYRTLAVPDADRARLRTLIESGQADALCLTSTSTLENTLDALDGDAGLLTRLTVASIGPITTEAAARRGVRVDLTAESYTVPGLVAALERHYLELAAKDVR